MLSHIIMKNVIKNDTPADMLDVAVNTLCSGSLTPLNISNNLSNNMFDNLVSHFNIEPPEPPEPQDKPPKEGTMKRIYDYGCKASLKIDGWIENFIHRYSLSCYKVLTAARSLTDKPELISKLCDPELTAHSLRVCHGELMRKEYPDDADQMIKRRVQMFHDTAQEWCDHIALVIETCDKAGPMLCRSDRVTFF